MELHRNEEHAPSALDSWRDPTRLWSLSRYKPGREKKRPVCCLSTDVYDSLAHLFLYHILSLLNAETV